MGSITGIIRDVNNTPLKDVSVLIVSGPSHRDIATVTGENGHFSIHSLKSGNYVIKAFAREESNEITVQVLPQQIPFVEIWLE